MTEPKNLYIRTVSLGNRKSCPICSNKLNDGAIFSSGEYQNGKWKTTDHFCYNCFPLFKKKIFSFQRREKRKIEFKGYMGFQIPEWMTPNED